MSEDLLFDPDGNVDVEGMIECRETRKVPPNPPPRKIGKITAKTIARRVVSELIDPGSSKTVMVMLFYIDSANSKNGACYPSEETVARKLGFRNTKAVTRANRYWRFHGHKVNGELLPFLTVAVKGRRRPDGTKESNAYHIGWLPLLASAADHHWCAEIRRAARAYVNALSVPMQKTNVS